jgi:hypothetical protein
VSDTATPTALGPLATRADVAALAGTDVSLVAPDRIDRLLEMASAAVRNWTHQSISLVIDDDVIVISDGTAELVLAERPVVEVSFAQVEDREPVGDLSWDSFGHLRRRDGLPWGQRYDHVAVTYTHGWDPVPDDVAGLVAAKVALFLAATEANPSGLSKVQTGVISATYGNVAGTEAALGPGALTQAEKDALHDYRLGSLAAGIGPP